MTFLKGKKKWLAALVFVATVSLGIWIVADLDDGTYKKTEADLRLEMAYESFVNEYAEFIEMWAAAEDESGFYSFSREGWSGLAKVKMSIVKGRAYDIEKETSTHPDPKVEESGKRLQFYTEEMQEIFEYWVESQEGPEFMYEHYRNVEKSIDLLFMDVNYYYENQ